MLSLRQLFIARGRLRDTVNDTAECEITQYAPIPPLNAFAVQAKFDSLTDDNLAYYNTSILFHDLHYSKEKTSLYKIGIEVLPGFWLYIANPSFNATPVQITCTCLDYYYVWQYYNNREGSRLGPEPPKYTRKTPPPPNGYPYANPIRTPGPCKHIMVMAQKLAEVGLLND